jgi:hypothetical protein
MNAEDDLDGEAPFDQEVEIRAAVPGQRCSLCGWPIVQGDRACAA